MADNVAITAGAGTTIATDDIGGTHYQRIKLVDGTLDGTDAIPGTAANGLDVDVTRIAAGETHIGEVGSKTTLTAITFSLDTNAYADNDVLADTQALSACLRANDGTGIIQDVIFNDKDDQGQAFDVIIFNANTSLGTENSAPNISDANADTIVGRFSVGAGDWYDLGGCRIANIRNIGICVKGATGTDDIYIGLISRGAGTYSASGITAIFKILCD